MEAKDGETGMVCLLQVVLRGLLAVDQVRVEHVELVSLGPKSLQKRTCAHGRRQRRDVVSKAAHWGFESEHVRQPEYMATTACMRWRCVFRF